VKKGGRRGGIRPAETSGFVVEVQSWVVFRESERAEEVE
jgi:hypothetical protein